MRQTISHASMHIVFDWANCDHLAQLGPQIAEYSRYLYNGTLGGSNKPCCLPGTLKMLEVFIKYLASFNTWLVGWVHWMRLNLCEPALYCKTAVVNLFSISAHWENASIFVPHTTRFFGTFDKVHQTAGRMLTSPMAQLIKWPSHKFLQHTNRPFEAHWLKVTAIKECKRSDIF